MPIMFVIPAPGRRVRDPRKVSEPLPAQGREVQDSPYWRRRIKEGDVSVQPRPAQVAKAKRMAKEE